MTAPEAAFIEAVVDVFVPADELTPSGTDLGLAVFIDRQLAGAWGKGDRLYMQGPWKQGPPGLGYQLPLTPAEFFRAGIDAVNRHCKKTYGQEFDQLAGPQKQQVLEGLDQAKIALEGVSAKQFFDIVYQATMEGMFSDPIYGGNRNKAAWKMVGYPGVVAVYATHIVNYRNKKYVVEPVSIADLFKHHGCHAEGRDVSLVSLGVDRRDSRQGARRAGLKVVEQARHQARRTRTPGSADS